MHKFLEVLTNKEKKVFEKLNSPQKIQDFLESLPINFEKNGDTLMSPRMVLQNRKAQCIEGAIFAAGVLWYHGEPPILLDLVTHHHDDSHVVTLFRRNGLWGSISKTNHAVLRYRDAVYESPRELAMSYFHEYFLDSGKKTMRSFALYDLRKVKRNWVTDEKDLWYINKALDKTKHVTIVSEKEAKKLRKADPIERKAGKLTVRKKK
jgi:hypothetical protein